MNPWRSAGRRADLLPHHPAGREAEFSDRRLARHQDAPRIVPPCAVTWRSRREASRLRLEHGQPQPAFLRSRYLRFDRHSLTKRRRHELPEEPSTGVDAVQPRLIWNHDIVLLRLSRQCTVPWRSAHGVHTADADLQCVRSPTGTGERHPSDTRTNMLLRAEHILSCGLRPCCRLSARTLAWRVPLFVSDALVRRITIVGESCGRLVLRPHARSADDMPIR